MTTPTWILLVEDDAADAELTLRALRGVAEGRIRHAWDGEEALALLAEAADLPNVVLLDLKLPRLDGLQVLERLRALPRTRHLPVVMLTSSREEPDIARAYALGVNSYIVKPVEFDAFVQAVAEAGLYWLVLNQAPDNVA